MDFIFNKPKNRIYEFLRAFSYASLIASILFLLVFLQMEQYKSFYKLFSLIGLCIVCVESFFIVNHVNAHRKKEQHPFLHSFFHHGINHMIYPVVYYVGSVVYIYLEENYLINTFLGILLFILFFIHYYYTSQHLHYGHIDAPHSHKASVKVDFIVYIFKFFSFFVFELALFKAVDAQKVSILGLFGMTFVVIAFYLYAHVNRKHELTKLTIFMIFMFALITSLAISNIKLYKVDYSASIATVLFYLSSGIFYHKIDGTFSYKVLLEYGSIAVLLSVFLFNV